MAADERCINCAYFVREGNYCASKEAWNPAASDNCGRIGREQDEGRVRRIAAMNYKDQKAEAKKEIALARERERMEIEGARYGIQKTNRGYRVGDREYSSYQGAMAAARHLSMKMTQEQMIRIIEENRARQQAVRELPQFTIRGDLHQMSEQKAFLEKQGFRVGQNDVYPGLYSREDYERAIAAIVENEIEGWWNYDLKDFPKGYVAVSRPKTPKKAEQEKPAKMDRYGDPEKPGKRDKYEAIKV